VARAAAAGSAPDLGRLVNLVKTGPDSQTPLFLPAFYANLNPRLIPSADQVDSKATNPDLENSIGLAASNAIQSLNYLAILKYLPPDANLLVWNRAREWIQFLHRYWACIPAMSGSQYPERFLYAATMMIIGKLKEDKEIAKELNQMPLLRVIVARAWKLFNLETEEGTPYDSLREVSTFLTNHSRGPDGRRNLEDFVEGAGGSPCDLASLAVTHLNRYVSRPHPVLSLFFLCGAIKIVVDNEDNTLFQDALLACGIITTFVRVAEVISHGRNNPPGDDMLLADDRVADNLLNHVWVYLNAKLINPHVCRPLREAVRAGIFRAIIASASNSNTQSDFNCFTDDCLRTIIGWFELFTVYYSVLSCIKPALHEVKDLQTVRAFTQSYVFNTWAEFWDTAQRRISIMTCYYESENWVSLKACGSLQVR
jgi:hypothetical protein